MVINFDSVFRPLDSVAATLIIIFGNRCQRFIVVSTSMSFDFICASLFVGWMSGAPVEEDTKLHGLILERITGSCKSKNDIELENWTSVPTLDVFFVTLDFSYSTDIDSKAKVASFPKKLWSRVYGTSKSSTLRNSVPQI